MRPGPRPCGFRLPPLSASCWLARATLSFRVDSRFILVTLLVKLGVAAAVSSAVVRSRYFKELLFQEERTFAQKMHLMLFIVTPFALGVLVRVSVRNFHAADLSVEMAILLGVIGGRVVGGVGGMILGLAALYNGEMFALPFDTLVGLVAGMLRNAAPDKEYIWTFTPFMDLSLYRWIRRNLPFPRMDWQTLFFLFILATQLARTELGRALPRQFFYIPAPTWTTLLAAYASTVACVAIPLKIWNNTRIEMKLQVQERLLLQARMEALQSQINPHFLFNTLNSIASLVRFDPDMARVLIVKLASIMRRLQRRGDAFVRLSDEVEFIDDYLDIEVVRFGRDKLRVIKDLDPATLDTIVPSMVLQPLVENSIKHGLAPRIEGGSVTLRSRLADGFLVVEVQDDGVGMALASDSAVVAPGSGIGMSNVAERLKVLYGEAASMTISSADGKGTVVVLRVPVLMSVDAGESAGTVAYEARSSTQR
jgi:two-component system LytT family sensor kinase